MIIDERMITYIHSLEGPENPVIEQIEQEALDTHVPIIRKEMQSFLKVILMMKQPSRILEIGTAIGFSAILMSEYLPEDAQITTIEKYEKRIPIARENFRRAGREGQNIRYLPDAVRLLSDGGVLMSDNVLQDGDVIESRFAVERRNRTIHSRMREYLYELKHHGELMTSILPLGDGIALSVKKRGI